MMIDLLEKLDQISDFGTEQVSQDYVQELWRDASERIIELEAQLSRWISVEDRLPERMGNYDVWLSGDNMYKPRRMADVVYSKEHGAWLSIMAMGVHPYADQITHWMPLPDQPSEVIDHE